MSEEDTAMSSVFFCKKTSIDLKSLFDIDPFRRMLSSFGFETRLAY